MRVRSSDRRPDEHSVTFTRQHRVRQDMASQSLRALCRELTRRAVMFRRLEPKFGTTSCSGCSSCWLIACVQVVGAQNSLCTNSHLPRDSAISSP